MYCNSDPFTPAANMCINGQVWSFENLTTSGYKIDDIQKWPVPVEIVEDYTMYENGTLQDTGSSTTKNNLSLIEQTNQKL
ncbi:unnamed protein product [Didymodactylos carnosus]|uniref:Uncharacterized protein n=1 Tax=Didymodactylos carnosus TaxID=1234261 RepID=A0A814PJP0_9BILA|nr:unnamed protein product [Didymodactylos carnosus]CAF3871221.1 unnamed protein product [Didymodactylos carnosus]